MNTPEKTFLDFSKNSKKSHKSVIESQKRIALFLNI